jgi:two-component system OmpR family sensor kinase
MAVLILLLLGTIYFNAQKQAMLSEHRLSMQLVAESYIPKLLRWIKMNKGERYFPKNLAYSTALLDDYGRIIASNIKHLEYVNVKKELRLHQGYIYFRIPLAMYDQPGRYLIFETKDNQLWLYDALRVLIVSGIVLFLSLFFVGYYLAKFFLRPMRDAVHLLDQFIKDTTHELNTPVSTIATNIETFNREGLSEGQSKKMNRIDIAAKTIATIYDDLTYLILNHNVSAFDELVDFQQLIEERSDYFLDMIEQKKITLERSLDPCSFAMDRTKAIRLVDNLLSNAIKYNVINGKIIITLRKNALTIADTGRGIPEDKIQTIFQRYQRADVSVGGFGIGLHIVAMIVKEYDHLLHFQTHTLHLQFLHAR